MTITAIWAALPILIPFISAAIALLLWGRPRAQGWFAFGTMLVSFGVSLTLLLHVWQTGTPVTLLSGAWLPPFGIVLVADLPALFFVAMSQLVISMGMLYALGARDACVQYPPFYPLFLTLAVGLTGSFLTGDLFNLFVFIELLVISGAALTAISDDRYGAEAAYKYFYISLLASAFLLLASGTLYISYGTLNLADLAQRIAADSAAPLLPAAIALLTATFMVKGAVFPFHFWQPDFHTAAPTPVHAVLSSVVVKLGIYGFLRLSLLLFPAQAETLRALLVITGVIGVFYGGLGAAGTYDAKRMLAYSTMGQLGFILVGIGWGTPAALTAALVFAFNHAVIKAAMLMLAGAVASRAAVKGAAFENITGLGKVIPSTGVLFFVGSLGLAGIPPTNGFVSKMLLFRSGFEAQAFVSLAWIGVGSFITLFYTLRAFQKIWWHAPLTDAKPKPYGDQIFAPLLLLILALALGIWAQPLLALAQATTAWMLTPQFYFLAVLGG